MTSPQLYMRWGARGLLAAALLLGVSVTAPADILNVDTADDICPTTANPCVISQRVELVDGALLDFGTRAVQIVSGGQLDARAGDFSLSCGSLTVSTGTATAIKLSGPVPGQVFTRGGFADITAVRSCSLDTSVVCVRDLDCAIVDAGTCTIGGGGIVIEGRINGSADEPALIVIRAAGSIEVRQRIMANGSADDSDGGGIELDAGDDVLIANRIEASGGPLGGGGDISVFSARDIVIQSVIDATGGDFDGGFIEIDALRDVNISDDLNASATSGEGFGGEITVAAGRDLFIVGGSSTNRLTLLTDGNMSSELFGGDGGVQEYTAGRDVQISPFVVARARGAAPDGFGEEILVEGGRDVFLQGDFDAKARGGLGAAGAFTASAGRRLEVATTTSVVLTGGAGGGEASLDAETDLVMAGSIDASGGINGGPGTVDMSSFVGAVSVSGTVTLGGADPAGAVPIATFDGCSVDFLTGAKLDLKAAGSSSQIIGHETISVGAGATLSAPADGSHTMMYRDAAKPPAINGTVTPPPVLTLNTALLPCPVCGNGEVQRGESCDDGNTLSGDGCSSQCQVEGCVAQTPGWPDVPLCDDGLLCTADRCDAVTQTCMHEVQCGDNGDCTEDLCDRRGACMRVPRDALCDDGVDCTLDRCRLNGRCEHVADAQLCNDGIECTLDSCDGTSGCVQTPEDTLCDDANVCTADACTSGIGCEHTPIEGPCDDGASCTQDDACVDGACTGVSICPLGEFCDPTADICRATTTTTTTVFTTTTTVATTTTTLVGAVCGDGIVTGDEQCDAGTVAWVPGRSCRDCRRLACGDPDDSGSQTASDALFTLRAAVGVVACECVCDVDGNSAINVTDALRVLRVAVGTGGESLVCCQ